MKKLFILAFTFCYSLAISQNLQIDSLLKADADLVIEEIKFMYDYDQALREYTIFKTFDKRKTDSIESLDSEVMRKFIAQNKFKTSKIF